MTGWLKNYSPQRFLISFGLAAFIGLMASIASEVFVLGIAWINEVLFIAPHARKGNASAKLLPWLTLVVPVIGGLIVGGLLILLRSNRPHGIPDVIFSSQTGNSHIAQERDPVDQARVCPLVFLKRRLPPNDRLKCQDIAKPQMSRGGDCDQCHKSGHPGLRDSWSSTSGVCLA